MVFNMALQLPGILRTIRAEHREINRLVQRHHYRVVISDNRFGCCAEGAKNIFISHQLQPIVPTLLRWPVRMGLARFLNHFDELWVPDLPGPDNLSGRLSCAAGAPKCVRYIGPLSRMQPLSVAAEHDVIAVLSGPEPQRTYLEAELLQQAHSSNLQWIVVQGKPTEHRGLQVQGNVRLVPFMGTEALNQALCSARFFVGRSGYSTIMDLCALNVPALLVPTPGQTEQEYLAQRMAGFGCAWWQRQGKVAVDTAFQNRTLLKPWPEFDRRSNLLQSAVEQAFA